MTVLIIFPRAQATDIDFGRGTHVQWDFIFLWKWPFCNACLQWNFFRETL